MAKYEFENGILGFIPKEDWLDVGFNVERPGDPIDGLVGDIRTDNLVAKWESIAAEYQVPLMAQFHGFDTEAQQTFRVPVDTHNIEKGLIKVKINQSERMRALLRSGVQNDAMYDYVINDGIRLADQVVTRTKVAKNEMLATGKITIKENNLDLVVDYGVPDAQKNLTVDFGAGASAPVPDQLEALLSQSISVGSKINGFLTSRAVMNKLRRNAAIQKAINGNGMVGQLVSNADLNAYLSSEFGFDNIVINDLTYGTEGTPVSGRPHVTANRYFPENGITFFSTNLNGKLGDGLWGDPPETDVAQFINGSTSEVSPFVYVTQYAENDPAVLWTKASALFIPVLYNPNSLYLAKAIETAGT